MIDSKLARTNTVSIAKSAPASDPDAMRGASRNAAAQTAADQAKLKTYDVRVVPEPKSFLERLLERGSGGKDEPGHVSSAVRGNALLKLAAPYLQNLDRQRTAAITSALSRLEILQKEGVVLTMPEYLLQQ